MAVQWGRVRACRLAAGTLLALVAFTWLPALARLYGPAYVVPIVVLAALVVRVVAQLLTRPDSVPTGRLGRQLKGGMVLGLGAVALAEIAG